MYDFKPNAPGIPDWCSQPGTGRNVYAVSQANGLFNRALWRGRMGRIRSRLLHRPFTLRDLDCEPGTRTCSRHYGGLQSVPLKQICGSLGRATDFDVHFRPLHERSRNRWVSIAIACLQRIPLEPVSLIRIADCYFVQDGHHRVSVARALGEENIDAEITVFEMRQPFGAEMSPVRPVVASLLSGKEVG